MQWIIRRGRTDELCDRPGPQKAADAGREGPVEDSAGSAAPRPEVPAPVSDRSFLRGLLLLGDPADRRAGRRDPRRPPAGGAGPRTGRLPARIGLHDPAVPQRTVFGGAAGVIAEILALARRKRWV